LQDRWLRPLHPAVLPIKTSGLDDAKGLAYQVQVQIPEYQMKSVEDIGTIPLKTGVSNPLLADVATFSQKTAQENTIEPVQTDW
jgi:hypothetical protein